MPVVFGYGSLISRVSAEKTLGRSLCNNDMRYAEIQDHLRSWTAQGDVKLLSKGNIRPCDALFLDLTQQTGATCNGVAINVSEHELRQLDIRECCYERHLITLNIGNDEYIKAYAYRVPEPDKQYYGITLAAYWQIIDQALLDFPETFTRQFWETTLPSEAIMVEGEYVFEDCAQNAAAGQCFSMV